MLLYFHCYVKLLSLLIAHLIICNDSNLAKLNDHVLKFILRSYFDVVSELNAGYKYN